MVSYDFLSYFIGGNAILYLLIHLPLDLLTLINQREKRKEEAEEYPPWEEGKNIIKIITVFTSLYFWTFFLGWPILHLLQWDGFILFFNFQIPYIGKALQYIGLILIGGGTLIACIGRIARGIKAISWGVPKELTTNLGFRIVRHPLYASYCNYFLGIPLAMLNFLLLSLLPGIIGYFFTAKYEESILIKEFGEDYKEYQKKVGMLIPFVGRRKD